MLFRLSNEGLRYSCTNSAEKYMTTMLRRRNICRQHHINVNDWMLAFIVVRNADNQACRAIEFNSYKLSLQKKAQEMYFHDIDETRRRLNGIDTLHTS